MKIEIVRMKVKGFKETVNISFFRKNI